MIDASHILILLIVIISPDLACRHVYVLSVAKDHHFLLEPHFIVDVQLACLDAF